MASLRGTPPLTKIVYIRAPKATIVTDSEAGISRDFAAVSRPRAIAMRHGFRQSRPGWRSSVINRAPLSCLLFCCFGTAPTDLAKWTKALQAGDEKSRIQAIDALGQSGPEAKGAVAGLIKLLSDPSAKVRAHAAHALQHIGPAAAEAASAAGQGRRRFRPERPPRGGYGSLLHAPPIPSCRCRP